MLLITTLCCSCGVNFGFGGGSLRVRAQLITSHLVLQEGGCHSGSFPHDPGLPLPRACLPQSPQGNPCPTHPLRTRLSPRNLPAGSPEGGPWVFPQERILPPGREIQVRYERKRELFFPEAQNHSSQGLPMARRPRESQSTNSGDTGTHELSASLIRTYRKG